MELKNFFAQDDQGNKLSGADCYVYQRGTENLIAALYKPNGLELSNPFTTDKNGLAQFAAANGLYDVRVVSGGRDYRLSIQFNDVAETVVAAGMAADRAEAARDATAILGNVKDDIAHGLGTTASGQRFTVLDPDAFGLVILYLNRVGVAVEEKRYLSASISSLTVNVGKPYPLKPMVRDGITSSAPISIQNSFLDIKIIGARPGKLYRAEWIGTGTTILGGGPNYEFLVTEYVKANYATSSADGAVPVIELKDVVAHTVEAGDTITRVFKNTRVEGVVVVLTYRPGALPAATSIQMNSPNTLAGWSWIIDENCYVQAVGSTDTELLALAKTASDVSAAAALTPMSSLSLNAGKPFPLKAMTRDGITSIALPSVQAAFLDIKVIGARPGKLYRLEWVGTGTTAFGVPTYAILFTEYEKANYALASATGKVQAITLNDIPASSIEDGAVITRTFISTRIEGLSFVVTYKPGALPVGDRVDMSNTKTDACWSWIIDESCYLGGKTQDSVLVAQVQAKVEVRLMSGAMVYSHGTNETLIAWRYSASQDIRVAIGRYGVNQVNDIGAIAFKPHNGGPLTLDGVWSVMTPRGTDWTGPLIVNADVNGSGSVTQFTGGNHGYTGEGGAATAEQVYRRVFAQGAPLIDGDTGSADVITFQWENLVQGSNTRDVPRYILREQHSFKVRPGSIETSTRITALEAVVLKRYYGLQAYLRGYNDSVHFLNGQQSARIAWADGLSSGASGDYPNAWSANIRGASGFNLLMWMDRTYGVAKLTNLVPSADMFFTASNKMYARLIDEGKMLAMAPGESFCWRGGYAMAPNLGVGIDLGARYFDAGTEVLVAAMTAAGSGRVALPTPDAAGKPATVHSGSVSFSERVEPDGVAVSSAGYAVGFAAL